MSQSTRWNVDFAQFAFRIRAVTLTKSNNVYDNKSISYRYRNNRQTGHEVLKAIQRVADWWAPYFSGKSSEEGDEFETRFGDIHVTRHKLIEVIPDKKIVWLTLYSKLTFLENPEEWTNTKGIFDITEKDGKTQLRLTHQGLTPEVECFENCTKGWTWFVTESLLPLIESGKGNPGFIPGTEPSPDSRG